MRVYKLNKEHRQILPNFLLNLEPFGLFFQVAHIEAIVLDVNFGASSCQMGVIGRGRITNRPGASGEHVAQIIRQLFYCIIVHMVVVIQRAVFGRFSHALNTGVRDQVEVLQERMRYVCVDACSCKLIAYIQRAFYDSH